MLAKCEICNREVDGRKALSYHCSMTHKVKFKEYVLKYELNGQLPICKCGCGTIVDSFFSGKYCEYINGHQCLGREISGKTREKISKAQIGRKLPDEWRQNIANSIKKSHKNNPELGRIVSRALTGRKYSEEHKQKISETRKQRIASGEIVLNVKKMTNTIIQKYLNGGFEWAKGHHLSTKDNKEHYYRSSWELKYMQDLDNDDLVKYYETEPFALDYEFEGKNRKYIPDFLIYYIDGHRELHEVGVKKLKTEYERNIAKLEAAKQWCKDNRCEFRLLTEEYFEPHRTK